MQKISPPTWLAIGLFVYPIFCLLSEILGWIIFGAMGLFKGQRFPEFGWGGIIGLLLGPPLGIVSAICSSAWKNQRYLQSRLVAAVGGLVIGGGWLHLLLPGNPFVWIGDFGFAVPPVLWSASLLLFAATARPSPP